MTDTPAAKAIKRSMDAKRRAATRSLQANARRLNEEERNRTDAAIPCVGDRVRVLPYGGRADNKEGIVAAKLNHNTLDVHFDDGDGGAFGPDDLEVI